jgi:hypothetical protein
MRDGRQGDVGHFFPLGVVRPEVKLAVHVGPAALHGDDGPGLHHLGDQRRRPADSDRQGIAFGGTGDVAQRRVPLQPDSHRHLRLSDRFQIHDQSGRLHPADLHRSDVHLDLDRQVVGAGFESAQVDECPDVLGPQGLPDRLGRPQHDGDARVGLAVGDHARRRVGQRDRYGRREGLLQGGVLLLHRRGPDEGGEGQGEENQPQVAP